MGPLYVNGAALLQMFRRLWATFWQICYRMSQGTGSLFVEGCQLSTNIGNFCNQLVVAGGLPIPSDNQPQCIVYPWNSWQFLSSKLQGQQQEGCPINVKEATVLPYLRENKIIQNKKSISKSQFYKLTYALLIMLYPFVSPIDHLNLVRQSL